MQSMAEALAHAKGRQTVSRTHKLVVKPGEIQNAPKRLELPKGFCCCETAA
jgi:hypothetical protein